MLTLKKIAMSLAKKDTVGIRDLSTRVATLLKNDTPDEDVKRFTRMLDELSKTSNDRYTASGKEIVKQVMAVAELHAAVKKFCFNNEAAFQIMARAIAEHRIQVKLDPDGDSSYCTSDNRIVVAPGMQALFSNRPALAKACDYMGWQDFTREDDFHDIALYLIGKSLTVHEALHGLYTNLDLINEYNKELPARVHIQICRQVQNIIEDCFIENIVSVDGFSRFGELLLFTRAAVAFSRTDAEELPERLDAQQKLGVFMNYFINRLLFPMSENIVTHKDVEKEIALAEPLFLKASRSRDQHARIVELPLKIIAIIRAWLDEIQKDSDAINNAMQQAMQQLQEMMGETSPDHHPCSKMSGRGSIQGKSLSEQFGKNKKSDGSSQPQDEADASSQGAGSGENADETDKDEAASAGKGDSQDGDKTDKQADGSGDNAGSAEDADTDADADDGEGEEGGNSAGDDNGDADSDNGSESETSSETSAEAKNGSRSASLDGTDDSCESSQNTGENGNAPAELSNELAGQDVLKDIAGTIRQSLNQNVKVMRAASEKKQAENVQDCDTDRSSRKASDIGIPFDYDISVSHIKSDCKPKYSQIANKHSSIITNYANKLRQNIRCITDTDIDRKAMGYKLDSSRLMFKDKRWIARGEELDMPPLSITIMVDQSGSMDCSIAKVREICVTLAEIFGRNDVPVAICGHSVRYGKVGIEIFKSFDDESSRYTIPALEAHGGTLNGIPLAWSGMYADKFAPKESRNFIIFISDGDSDDKEFCRETYEAMTKRGKNIMFLAIDGAYGMLAQIFPKKAIIDCNDISRIPNMVMKAITKLITR